MNATEIRLLRRPTSRAAPSDFAARPCEARPPGDGEVLVVVQWLSIDPYLNERAIGDRAGAAVEPGEAMPCRGIGVVAAGALPAGTQVAGEFGWRTHATVPHASLRVIKPHAGVPTTWWLSALGMPGITAWLELHRIGTVAPGERIVVTSAAGTVGSLAVQLARDAGAEVVGVAGGPAKCAWVGQLGARALDRTRPDFAEQLRQALRPGFDVLLEHTAGSHVAAMLACAREHARVVLTGHVAAYWGEHATIDADLVLARRLRVQGFLVHDHARHFDEARQALLELARAGRLQMRETVHEGLAAAPFALDALLAGRGIGKHLVRVAPSDA